MTNYFELFDKRLAAIEVNQQEILTRLSANPSSNADEVGGVDLASKVTRLSKARIYTLVSERAIPHSKRGNRLTFHKSQLIEWLKKGNRDQKEGVIA